MTTKKTGVTSHAVMVHLFIRIAFPLNYSIFDVLYSTI